MVSLFLGLFLIQNSSNFQDIYNMTMRSFRFFQHLATSALSSSNARAPYGFTISRVISDSKQLKFSENVQYDNVLFSFFFKYLATSALSSSNARARYVFTISRVISYQNSSNFQDIYILIVCFYFFLNIWLPVHLTLLKRARALCFFSFIMLLLIKIAIIFRIYTF